MKIKNTFSIVAMFALIAAVLGCGTMDAFKKAGPAADKFHAQFNSGEFDAMYDDSDDGFKKNTTKEEWLEFVTAVRTKLGTVKDQKQSGWFVNANAGGTFATLKYEVEFTEGTGEETLVFRIDGDEAKLFSYNINSKELITK